MSNAAKMIREKSHLVPKNGPVPNRRILVIDDEPEIGQAIRRVLAPDAKKVTPIRRSSRSAEPEANASSPSAPEFDVVVVKHPDEAIEAVTHALRENRPFAMGFFDVVLGAEMDGIELVKQCLSVDPKMFAVFVTAYQDRSVDMIGNLLGEEHREKWDYINKPFTDGEILQKARAATSLWDLQRLKDWQEERLAEANQLLLNSEKQNAVAAVGRSVAHEFGNLLTHIVGNAELALENRSPEAMRAALDVILKASDTATNVLKRFRKMHGSTEEPADHAKFNVGHAIEEAAELLEFQFRKRYIHVIRNESQPMIVTGNHHAFIQVFVNLFINAMHAMPSGGDIFIQLNSEGDDHEIVFRDTGTGIPEELLEKVTEPLFTTKGKESSGLGLSICKEIVEIEHCGELKISNHPKGGVQITIRLHEGEPHE